MKRFLSTLLTAVAFAAGTVSGQTTFEAFLTGLGENPPNASPATGFGTVVLSADHTEITVDLSWSGLLGPATGAHIRGPGGVGTNAPVIFSFTGVSPATAGAIPEQTFSITPTQVNDLFAGYLYMNVHDSIFPGGEIRGQLLLVPEPSSLALVGLGAVGLAIRARNRSRQTAA